MKTYRNIFRLFTISSSFTLFTESFAPHYTPGSHTSIPSTRVKYEKKNLSFTKLHYASNDDERNDTKLSQLTDVLHFLTQRSIQNFIFLLHQCRDPHTAHWIEDLLGIENLMSFHGYGALTNAKYSSWEHILLDMMNQPLDVVLVEIKKIGMNRGLSKNNPYRQPENETMTVEIDIDPPSLAGRILAVREKISKEWLEDLDLVQSVNEKILSSYHSRSIDARQKEGMKKTQTKKKKKKSKRNDVDEDVGSESEPYVSSTSSSNDSSSKIFSSPWQEDKTYDRYAIYLLNNHPNFNDPGSTPIRASNFDLLCLLSTQESIHRVIQSYSEAGEEKSVSLTWLSDFYMAKFHGYFNGNQVFGRADDFLDELLSTPPSLKTIGKGEVGFIDPFAIAEDIILERGIVAEEWKDVMQNVSRDHESLRQEIWIKQMERWGQKVETSKPKTEKKSSSPVHEEVLSEWE